MRLYKIILLISLIAVNPALADESPGPLHFVGRYDFAWTGIALGKLVLGIDETADSYKMHLVVASAGIVNLFTRHMSDTVASGRRVENAYVPEYYESYYKTKNKPRHIKLEFDKKGAIKTEINEPPEDRSDRPEVPHALKDKSYDPLTGLMVLRSGAKELHAFDAKRLYSVKRQEFDKGTLFVEGKQCNSLYCVLSRTPLSGLTAKEIKEYQKGEPPLAFYFSNDKRRIPLAVSVPILIGYVTGVLVKECREWKDCAIPADAK